MTPGASATVCASLTLRIPPVTDRHSIEVNESLGFRSGFSIIRMEITIYWKMKNLMEVCRPKLTGIQGQLSTGNAPCPWVF